MTKLQSPTDCLINITTLTSNTTSDESLHYVIHELNCPVSSQVDPVTPLLTTVPLGLHVWLLASYVQTDT